MISIMTTLNLLEKLYFKFFNIISSSRRNPTDNRSDTFEVYQWNGPDIFNNKSL